MEFFTKDQLSVEIISHYPVCLPVNKVERQTAVTVCGLDRHPQISGADGNRNQSVATDIC